LIDELQDTLKGMPLDDKARTEINELTNTLKSNFDKVVHHGRRADAIVSGGAYFEQNFTTIAQFGGGLICDLSLCI
jgi:hypothetical protein